MAVDVSGCLLAESPKGQAMTDEKKPREWMLISDRAKTNSRFLEKGQHKEWIVFDVVDAEIDPWHCRYDKEEYKFRVIEFNAYEKLQSEVERVREETLNLRDHMRDDLREERDQLQAKLQAAEAEIDRQISLRKASESVDEEYRAKLEAAEAGLRFGRQAKQQRVLSLTLENANLRTDARRLAEALETVVAQFEGMQGSNDIRAHWHKIAREALTPEN